MLRSVHRSCVERAGSEAFFIRGRSHSYGAFAAAIAAVRGFLEASCEGEQNIGILADDDLETYAAVFGAWFAGKTMVPMGRATPPDRNASAISQAGVRTVLASHGDDGFAGLEGRAEARLVVTRGLEAGGGGLAAPREARDEDVAYILFTSGTTGVPKGVPIHHGALRAFLDAFAGEGHALGPADRFLQMFDLTFDLSLMSYCVPLTLGASVVTVPADGIKYLSVYRLLEEQRITAALLVPSILAHLRPYFPEIHLPELRCSLFCGEALHDDLVTAWAGCAPNARVQNVYGPTEATIFCLAYDCLRDRTNKSHNGVVSIGRPMKRTGAIIVDDALRPVAPGEKGELCLSGAQIMSSYWNDPERSRRALFEHDGVVHYRTGDLCVADADGDVMYAGRLDHQVKIQGFRVELGEIEHHAREVTGAKHVAAVAFLDAAGTTAVHLYLAGWGGEVGALTKRLEAKLPRYMIPARTTILDVLPLNANGKIDRPALARRAAGA